MILLITLSLFTYQVKTPSVYTSFTEFHQRGRRHHDPKRATTSSEELGKHRRYLPALVDNQPRCHSLPVIVQNDSTDNNDDGNVNDAMKNMNGDDEMANVKSPYVTCVTPCVNETDQCNTERMHTYDESSYVGELDSRKSLNRLNVLPNIGQSHYKLPDTEKSSTFSKSIKDSNGNSSSGEFDCRTLSLGSDTGHNLYKQKNKLTDSNTDCLLTPVVKTNKQNTARLTHDKRDHINVRTAPEKAPHSYGQEDNRSIHRNGHYKQLPSITISPEHTKFTQFDNGRLVCLKDNNTKEYRYQNKDSLFNNVYIKSTSSIKDTTEKLLIKSDQNEEITESMNGPTISKHRKVSNISKSLQNLYSKKALREKRLKNKPLISSKSIEKLQRAELVLRTDLIDKTGRVKTDTSVDNNSGVSKTDTSNFHQNTRKLKVNLLSNNAALLTGQTDRSLKREQLFNASKHNKAIIPPIHK